MQTKILVAGDVVGGAGRAALAARLPELVKELNIDCAIVNAENIANGSGITPGLYTKLMAAGVNLITLGDHIYRRKEIIPTLESSERMVRPANLPTGAPGKLFAVYETRAGVKVAVLSVLGRLYMKPMVDCPFQAVERVLAKIPKDVKVIVTDVHAEATSEKVAMGWFLDGKVSLVVGTHTHVPTADERILPGGSGYITDLGMTGPYCSVLGRSTSAVLQSLVTGVPTRLEVATEDVHICGVIATIDATTGRCTSIERLDVPVAPA